MTAVEYIEKQLGSRISDANIRISAPKFYEIINEAKVIEKNQALNQDAVSGHVQNYKDCRVPCLFREVYGQRFLKRK